MRHRYRRSRSVWLIVAVLALIHEMAPLAQAPAPFSRLERLGDEARKILTAAAVIGRTFPLDLLQAIVDVDADAVLDSVEEAERATLLTAHPGREARYGFVHELIRTTLISGLSLPRRQRLHLKIADAIERA